MISFVDVIHTNGGVLGVFMSIGDADYFPNDGTSQTGCSTLSSCSHNRAHELYTESIINIKQESISKFQSKYCASNVYQKTNNRIRHFCLFLLIKYFQF